MRLLPDKFEIYLPWVLTLPSPLFPAETKCNKKRTVVTSEFTHSSDLYIRQLQTVKS